MSSTRPSRDASPPCLASILILILTSVLWLSGSAPAESSPAVEAAFAAGPVAGDGQGMDGELERRVARMARVGSCGSPSFSPDGEELAVICDLSGTPQVWKVPARGGFPVLLTPFEDQITGVAWSPRGDWIAFSRAPGGGLDQQLYRVRPDGNDLTAITGGGSEAEGVNHWLGRWSREGEALAFASNRRTPEAMDVYLFHPDDGTVERVAENPGIGLLSDLEPGGRRAVLWRMQGRGDSDLVLLGLETGAETPLTPHEGPANIDGGLFGPDGRAVYFVTNQDRDRTVLVRLPLDGEGRPGEGEVLAAREDAELSGFDLTADGELAALVWNVAGRSEVELLDLSTGERSEVPELPAEIAAGPTFSRDGRRLALTFSGSARPRDVWVLERAEGAGDPWSEGRWVQVTRSPHPGVDLERLVRPELVRFEAHDGLELTAWLYRPPRAEDGPAPYVLSFHGGPEGQERPAFRSDYQALLSRGIGVFAPNVRGSSGFGKRFLHLDDRERRFDAVRDIRSSARYLLEEGLASQGSLGIMGGSYGGYMVMAGLTEFPDLFAAGANLFGVVNFETFFEQTEPWMAAISTTEYGDPRTQRQLLRRLSPIHRVDRVKAPTLVLHGANDTNVPVVEAEQVVESLESRGVPVKYVLFPDEGHGFRKTTNRITTVVALVEWFGKYLKGKAALEGKPAQPPSGPEQPPSAGAMSRQPSASQPRM